ncbi:MAG: acylphosphatase [Actinomycetota bacterium]|nr:acylphosphatase [Actinomycetota bacterium]MDQ2956604.1 acylphosphatase [Actinomycetota bacterium]
MTEDAPRTGEQVRLTAWVHGQVQGVGFRWWTRSRALELGLVGRATNLSDGRVEVLAEGDRDALDRLVEQLRGGATPGTVQTVVTRFGPARGGLVGFAER